MSAWLVGYWVGVSGWALEIIYFDFIVDTLVA